MSDQPTITERWTTAKAAGDEHLATPLAGDVGFILAIKRDNQHVTRQVLGVPDDAELEAVYQELIAALG